MVGVGEAEIEGSGALEIVERDRRLPQTADRSVAHALLVKRIVDPKVGERRIDRPDLHTVVLAVHVVDEIGKRPDGIVEKIGFERFADAALLFGRILQLALFVLRLERIGPVEVGVLAPLLGTQQSRSVELRVRRRRRRHRQQTGQHCGNDSFQGFEHTDSAAKIIKKFDVRHPLRLPAVSA